MKTKLTTLLLIAFTLLSCKLSNAQNQGESAAYLKRFDEKQLEIVLGNYHKVRDFFEEAYEKYPQIPRGSLEAVAFQYSRFCTENTKYCHESDENDHGMPHSYTVMGLTSDGKGVFRENAKTVSRLSGLPLKEVVDDNRTAVIAYAAAFAQLQRKRDCYSDSVERYADIFVELCELPEKTDGEYDFAVNSFLYMIYAFLDNDYSAAFGVPRRKIDMKKLFGDELKTLRSSFVSMEVNTEEVRGNEADYASAVFNAAASCNYTTGRGGVQISSVTIHYTQGSYAGSIAWFKNCASKVSAHYIIRSFDGQVTQMVWESDKAWHVGAANSYTVGIEHEAMGDIVSYFTSSMYQASAGLVRDICTRRNINPHRVFYRDTLDDGTVLNDGVHSLGGATACTQIRGHQHYPSQTHTDPGQHWDWNLYYKLVNPGTPVTMFTDSSGVFTDSGGTIGDYGNDERNIFAIHFDGADSIVIEFSQFELEANYDFMWIYNGNSTFSPLIGRWNTTSPGRVVVAGEDVVVEFRSDCATTAAGWVADWHACKNTGNTDNGNGDGPPGENGEHDDEDDLADGELPDDNDGAPDDISSPTTIIDIDNTKWITKDFTASFSDNDDIGLKWRFYQVIESDGNVWAANHRDGFICDNFDHSLNQAVWVNNYTCPWKILSASLCQTNANVDYSGIAARINGSIHEAYLYDFYIKFVTAGKCSFFFNCNNAPSLTHLFSGYEICFDKTEKSVKLYRIILGAKRLLKKVSNIAFADNTNYLYRVVFDNVSGEILLKRHANTIFKVTDGVMATTPYSYIAFATCQAAVNVDNLRVYGSRGSTVHLTVGNAESCNLRTQAINGSPLTKLKSIVVDKSYKTSSLAEKLLKVDYTPPATVANLSVNEETVTLGNGNVVRYLNASWDASSDNQSGISRYLHVNSNWPHPVASYWTDNGLATQCHHCCSNSGSTMKFSVVAENRAGLRSAIARYETDTNKITYRTDIYKCSVTIDGQTMNIALKNGNKTSEKNHYIVFDISGRRISEGFFVHSVFVNLNGFAKGTYIVKVNNGSDILETHKIVKL